MDQFIPGIYNYCDRWCERCTFAARCRVYERTGKLSPEQLDMNNKAFWDSLSGNFEEAARMLYKAAAEMGFDLDNALSPEEEKAMMEREDLIEQTARNHELAKLCKQYRDVATPFAEGQEEYIANTRQMIRELRLGTKTEDEVVNTTATIGDCLDVILWYLYFIDAKLQRALHGKMDDEQWAGDPEESGFAKDSDGSAKIAIIGVERSINAWIKLHELMPASEDVAISALALLSKIKRVALREFPHAMAFVRPGFDE